MVLVSEYAETLGRRREASSSEIFAEGSSELFDCLINADDAVGDDLFDDGL